MGPGMKPTVLKKPSIRQTGVLLLIQPERRRLKVSSEIIAEHQPVTFMVNSVRALTQGRAAEVLLGHPASYWVSRSLLWCVVLVGVFGPLAVARYRKG